MDELPWLVYQVTARDDLKSVHRNANADIKGSLLCRSDKVGRLNEKIVRTLRKTVGAVLILVDEKLSSLVLLGMEVSFCAGLVREWIQAQGKLK